MRGGSRASLPGDLEHVFFTESGSVAVEVAMKMALQFRFNRGDSARTRFLSFEHAYHGDTFAAMSVCDPEEGMHRLFREVLAKQLVVPLPATADLAREFERTVAAHAHELTAIVVEPLVQAAGGMKFHSPETLAAIAATARRHGLLLIVDEIATGFGRTGKLFACEHAGIVPDIVTLSKALTGGTLPLAATVATRRVFEAFLSDDPARALMHGPTFAGNALACAAANASLDLFEREPRLAQAEEIAAQLRSGLEACRGLAGVRDVRVLGAIGVVQLDRAPKLDALRRRFVEHGVWIRPFGGRRLFAAAARDRAAGSRDFDGRDRSRAQRIAARRRALSSRPGRMLQCDAVITLEQTGSHLHRSGAIMWPRKSLRDVVSPP